MQKALLQFILYLGIIFTHLCHEGSHFKSQLFVHREVALVNFIIHLVRQEEALSLRLSFHLRSETQPVQAQNNKKTREKLSWNLFFRGKNLAENGIMHTPLHFHGTRNLTPALKITNGRMQTYHIPIFHCLVYDFYSKKPFLHTDVCFCSRINCEHTIRDFELIGVSLCLLHSPYVSMGILPVLVC